MTSSFFLIGAESWESQHKRPPEGRFGYPLMDPSQKKKRDEEEKNKEEQKEDGGRKIEERRKRRSGEVERDLERWSTRRGKLFIDKRRKKEKRDGGRRKETRRKESEEKESLRGCWGWLPPELQMLIKKMALQGLIQDRLDMGLRQIHH